MNERIQTLLAKFKETESTHRGAHVLIGSDEIEKFAELIVQRTLDIVEAHTEIFQSDEARAMVEHIKQSVRTDFGVEK